MYFYLVLLITCGVATATSKNEGRIVGGDKVSIENYPYQVALYTGGSQLCGGSILSKNFILTAAHCVERRFPHMITVVAALNDTSKSYIPEVIRRSVVKIIQHPLFGSIGYDTPKNDIAILKVYPSLPFSSSIQPIAPSTTRPKVGEYVTITGYGDIRENGPSTHYLSAVSVPVATMKICVNAYPELLLTGFESEIFCAGFRKGGKDSCQGDSGGPVVANGKLVGIVSFGEGCAKPKTPGVYTNVANYYSWITEHVEELQTTQNDYHNDNRISDGVTANIYNYPYQVAIYFDSVYICAGSILNSNFILTAGQRINNIIPSRLTVCAGVNNMFNIYQYTVCSRVYKTILHPKYQVTQYGAIRNDIALLKLLTPLQLGLGVLPINIGDFEPTFGVGVTVSGYGATFENGPYSGQLLSTRIPVVSKQQCYLDYKKIGNPDINNEVFCAGSYQERRDACNGDVGSPAVLYGKLVGIVSYGYSCGKLKIPGVYTNIAYYRHWIYMSLAL